jgi:hypothetical protein
MIKASFLCILLAVMQHGEPGVRLVEPRDGQTTESFLTTVLRWTPCNAKNQDAKGDSWESLQLTVSQQEDFRCPIVDVRLDPKATSYRLALRPNANYFWRVVPCDSRGPQPAAGFCAAFKTGKPRIDTTTDGGVRYKNPRRGMHVLEMAPPRPGTDEPLSPWYEVKQYVPKSPPKLPQIRKNLPEPVWEGHADAIDAYWYCWKTLCDVWYYAPSDKDHQAVANLIGIPTWGQWGSTMVWDTAFILYFAKYGHAAYPMIEGYDNAYARQHENGFICRESDRENREVYVVFPVNPPLFAWTEWEYYQLSGDKERLRKVFLPIVKHYEWFMTYQRRENGLYWTNGAQEADDSPRNTLAYYTASTSSQQALAALCLAKIARTIGRNDMAEFFEAQHAEIGKMVNEYFWDQRHRIYNDLTQDKRFITELNPGVFCKHCHIFWPMLAEIVPADRVDGMIAELRNPASFNRRNGVASLSADSAGYSGGPEGIGGYWRGSVWPPIQCMVQEGLKAVGDRELARQIALKYQAAVVETYAKQHDITEFLAPDRPLACGCGKFVGWGGIGPVANLIEYVLGFDVCAPKRQVVWRITLTEKHGIKNLRLGNVSTDLICERRPASGNPCHITVSGSGGFSLVVVTPHRKEEKQISPGVHHFVVE